MCACVDVCCKGRACQVRVGNLEQDLVTKRMWNEQQRLETEQEDQADRSAGTVRWSEGAGEGTRESRRQGEGGRERWADRQTQKEE